MEIEKENIDITDKQKAQKNDEDLEKIIDEATQDVQTKGLEKMMEEVDKEKLDDDFESFEKMETEKIDPTIDLLKQIFSQVAGIEKQYITADLIAAIFNYGTNQNLAIAKIGKLTEAINANSKTIKKLWVYLLVATLGSGVFGYTMAVYQHETIKPFFYEIGKEMAKKVLKGAE